MSEEEAPQVVVFANLIIDRFISVVVADKVVEQELKIIRLQEEEN